MGSDDEHTVELLRRESCLSDDAVSSDGFGAKSSTDSLETLGAEEGLQDEEFVRDHRTIIRI